MTTADWAPAGSFTTVNSIPGSYSTSTTADGATIVTSGPYAGFTQTGHGGADLNYALTWESPVGWRVGGPTDNGGNLSVPTGVNPTETSYSLYGHIIPLSYGSPRIGGEIIAGPWISGGLASFCISFGVPFDPSDTRTLLEIAFDSQVVWTLAGGFTTEAFTYRFYGGSLTQAADALEIANFGANAVAYRPQILLWFQNLPLAGTKFGKIPYVSARFVDSTGGVINFGTAFQTLAYSPWVGYTSAQFATSGITDGVTNGGFVFAKTAEFLATIQQFGRFYSSWDIIQTDKLRIIDRGSTVTADISLNATRLMGAVTVTRQGQDTVTKDLELSTIDPDADYTIVPSVAQRPRNPVAVTTSVGKDTAYLPVIMDSSTRTAIVTLTKYSEETTRKTISGTAMAYGLEIEPGALVAIRGLGTAFNNETFKIVETLHGANNTVEFTAKSILKCTVDTSGSGDAPPLGGLLLWYDASVFASLTLSGSLITRAADQSGHGNNLGPGTVSAGQNPNYSATGFNSLPTMLFAGEIASCPALAMGTGNTLTFFMVGTLSSSSAANARGLTYYDGTGSDFNQAGSWIGPGRSGTTTSLGMTRNSVNSGFVTIVYDAPAVLIGTINSSGVMTLYINGVPGTTGTSPGSWVSGGTFSVGGSSSDFSPWHGAISEVGVSTDFTDATGVATLYANLKAKWNL